MIVKLRYVHRDVDRHGNVRIYFWRGHPKIRLREQPGSAEFSERYHELLRGVVRSTQPAASGTSSPAVGTYRWPAIQYFRSAAFRRLSNATQILRRRVIEQTFDEPIYPGAAETFADLPLARLTPRAIRALRDRKQSLPGAAHNCATPMQQQRWRERLE